MSLKVKVSSNYHGVGWYDPKSRMNFMKGDGVITVPDGTNMYNVNRYINLNYLEIVKDSEPVIEKETIINISPNKLLSKESEQVIDNAEEIIKTEAVEETVEVEITNTTEEVVEETIEEVVEVQEEIKDGKVACQYCGKKYSQKGLGSHEKACKENPDNK